MTRFPAVRSATSCPALTRSLLSLLAVFLAVPVSSETLPADISLTVDPGRAAIGAFAVAIDANRAGALSSAEMDTAGRAIFASMDVDADGSLTRAEMIGREHGARRLAAFRCRTQACDAAVGVVFDPFDRDLSGTIDAVEPASSMHAAWTLADRDGDGTMSLTEFREGFVVTAAVRHGLAGRARVSPTRP